MGLMGLLGDVKVIMGIIAQNGGFIGSGLCFKGYVMIPRNLI